MASSVATNRKAYRDYTILETVEAGLMLTGTEVKSIRAGKANLKDGFARIEKGEVFLYNVHISHYAHGNRENHDPLRVRKILLHRRQIFNLERSLIHSGTTIVPLKLYFKGPYAKIELGLARGKRFYDKRQDLKKKEDLREINRTTKAYNRK